MMLSALLAAFCGLLPLYLLRFSVSVPGIGSLPTTALEVFFWVLFAAWMVTDGRKPGAWRAFGNWLLPLTLLLTAATVSVAVSPDFRAALGLWRAYFLEPLLFFPMFTDIITRYRKGWWVLAALAALTAAIGVSAIIQKATGYGIPNPLWQAAETRRVTSVFGFPNAIGLFCAPLVVLLTAWSAALWGLTFAPTASRRWRNRGLALLPLAAAALGALAIVFAVSEGAMIGAAAGIGALMLFHRRTRAIALAGVIAACAAVLLYAPLQAYVQGIVGFTDDGGSVRMIIWKETVALLRDSPVFGAGLSGYPLRIDPYHAARHIEIFQYPHQFVLNWWAETGLMGLAAISWILGRFFRLSWRLARGRQGENAMHTGSAWVVRASAAAMVALLVHGLVDVPYFKNDLAFLFWILVGITESVRLLSEGPHAETASDVALEAGAGELQRPPGTWLT